MPMKGAGCTAWHGLKIGQRPWSFAFSGLFQSKPLSTDHSHMAAPGTSFLFLTEYALAFTKMASNALTSEAENGNIHGTPAVSQ